MKLLLTKNDYQFIEYICKKYKVSKGKNHERNLEILLNEYKNWRKGK